MARDGFIVKHLDGVIATYNKNGDRVPEGPEQTEIAVAADTVIVEMRPEPPLCEHVFKLNDAYAAAKAKR